MVDCAGPAGDPQPGTQEWTDRDRANQICATERLTDELSSPAFAATFQQETPGLYVGQNAEMLMDPAHPHLTLGQLVPGGSTTDPFRTLNRWTAAKRGRVTPVSFPAADGATLNGYVFRPPACVKGPYPTVVITTGSIQGYQQMYFWAAEGLAEAGYMVLTYDVQGQGDSDTLPAPDRCTGPDNCAGVPFQQGYNFYQGAEDSLNYLFSSKARPYRGTFFPHAAELDKGKVGVAGHSLGASAVSVIGQCDPRVKAIVGWDNLAPATGKCTDVATDGGFPAGSPEAPTNKVPALGINSEYFFNPTSMSAPPDAQSKSGGYRQLVGQRHRRDADRAALVDAPRVHVRALHPPREPPRRAGRLVLHDGLVRPLPARLERGVQAPHREVVRRQRRRLVDRRRHLRRREGHGEPAGHGARATCRTRSRASRSTTA